jgi:hypothetical protein
MGWLQFVFVNCLNFFILISKGFYSWWWHTKPCYIIKHHTHIIIFIHCNIILNTTKAFSDMKLWAKFARKRKTHTHKHTHTHTHTHTHKCEVLFCNAKVNGKNLGCGVGVIPQDWLHSSSNPKINAHNFFFYTGISYCF